MSHLCVEGMSSYHGARSRVTSSVSRSIHLDSTVRQRAKPRGSRRACRAAGTSVPWDPGSVPVLLRCFGSIASTDRRSERTRGRTPFSFALDCVTVECTVISPLAFVKGVLAVHLASSFPTIMGDVQPDAMGDAVESAVAANGVPPTDTTPTTREATDELAPVGAPPQDEDGAATTAVPVAAAPSVEEEAAAASAEPDADDDGPEDTATAVTIPAAVGRFRVDSATSLWRAAEYGDLGRIKMLLDAGHDVNALCDDPGWHHKSPLSAAVDGNEPLAVRLLLRRGANPDLQDGDGDRYPLHWAAAFGDYSECAELLVQVGASLDALDAHGRTPLQFARSFDTTLSRLGASLLGRPAGRPAVSRVLELAAAATTPRAAWSAAHASKRMSGTFWKAAAAGDLKALRRCIDVHQQPIDMPRPAQTTRMSALALAVHHGQPKAVKLLLERRADANLAEPDGGLTPLHLCARAADRPHIGRLLLGSGADPDAVNRDGESAVVYARRLGRTQLASLLEASAGRQHAAAALEALLSADDPTRRRWLPLPSRAAALSAAIDSARRAGVGEEAIERAQTALRELSGAAPPAAEDGGGAATRCRRPTTLAKKARR